MAVYQVDYDLRKQRDYPALYERLRSYPMWCRPLESTWVIETSQTAVQVRDYLTGAMDSDDRILVARLTGEAAWRNVTPEVSHALKGLLKRSAA